MRPRSREARVPGVFVDSGPQPFRLHPPQTVLDFSSPNSSLTSSQAANSRYTSRAQSIREAAALPTSTHNLNEDILEKARRLRTELAAKCRYSPYKEQTASRKLKTQRGSGTASVQQLLAPKRLEQTRTKSVLELKLKMESPHELMVSAGGGPYAMRTDATATLKTEDRLEDEKEEELVAPTF